MESSPLLSLLVLILISGFDSIPENFDCLFSPKVLILPERGPVNGFETCRVIRPKIPECSLKSQVKMAARFFSVFLKLPKCLTVVYCAAKRNS